MRTPLVPARFPASTMAAVSLTSADGSCGTPAAYLTRVNGKLVDLGLPSPVAGGSIFSANVTLAAGTRQLAIQARDEAGNLGPNTGIAVR